MCASAITFTPGGCCLDLIGGNQLMGLESDQKRASLNAFEAETSTLEMLIVLEVDWFEL